MEEEEENKERVFEKLLHPCFTNVRIVASPLPLLCCCTAHKEGIVEEAQRQQPFAGQEGMQQILNILHGAMTPAGFSAAACLLDEYERPQAQILQQSVSKLIAML